MIYILVILIILFYIYYNKISQLLSKIERILYVKENNEEMKENKKDIIEDKSIIIKTRYDDSPYLKKKGNKMEIKFSRSHGILHHRLIIKHNRGGIISIDCDNNEALQELKT